MKAYKKALFEALHDVSPAAEAKAEADCGIFEDLFGEGYEIELVERQGVPAVKISGEGLDGNRPGLVYDNYLSADDLSKCSYYAVDDSGWDLYFLYNDEEVTKFEEFNPDMFHKMSIYTKELGEQAMQAIRNDEELSKRFVKIFDELEELHSELCN